MHQLNFPSYSFKIKTEDGKKLIFDRLRKKYVALQPEEIVRQHMISYLIEEKHYPASLMNNEISISYNGLDKRCDSVVYKNNAQPIMIIEYKAPSIKISQDTFDQIAVYNMKLHVDYLLISNGINHFCCKVDRESHQLHFLKDIPTYEELIP